MKSACANRNRRIYQHCRKLAGCRAEECLFIDDVAANVEAARRAAGTASSIGAATIWPELAQLALLFRRSLTFRNVS